MSKLSFPLTLPIRTVVPKLQTGKSYIRLSPAGVNDCMKLITCGQSSETSHTRHLHSEATDSGN
jgi:hypothetical protein